MTQVPLKLRDWIDASRLDWTSLSMNPNAIKFLEKNQDNIDWYGLSMNPNAVHILEQNPDKIVWSALCMNPNAIHLIEKNMDKIEDEYCWMHLSQNPNAYHLLKANFLKIHWPSVCRNTNPKVVEMVELNFNFAAHRSANDVTQNTPDASDSRCSSSASVNLLSSNPSNWSNLSGNPAATEMLRTKYFWNTDWAYLSMNPHPLAIRALEENPDRINWFWLGKNPNAVHIMEQNPDKICWYWVVLNPNAIRLLQQNPDKINWSLLSENPSAIEMLEQNQDKIDWGRLSSNPAIFVYDYAVMRENYRELKEELIQKTWHPDRVTRWLEAGMDLEDL